MLNLYNHLSWSFFLFTLFSFSLFTLVPISLIAPLYISLDLFSASNSYLSGTLYFDFMSCSFISVVLLISSVIMGYSFNYIAPYSNSKYFIWLTFLFVVSILFVVSMSNLFFIMLGWDGLGLVSFFLIVYYQNQSSITSGLFTLFINRLGDCFFLLSLSLSLTLINSQSSWVPAFCEDLYLVTALLCVTFMTNSAIFPFSPWLPLAIAAPTPISALVHSSTLVTSGLYLIMRYSHLILSLPSLSKFLIISSIFTSFYAGLNSLVEQDLNNLIALSTLSHLGFISLSFSSGLVILGFFHLLTHALFKSLLFIAIGDTMLNLSHSQDIRYLSSGSLLVPGSSSYIQVSCISLLGLPATSGFFSNDLVLETLNFSDTSIVLTVLIYTNVGFTFFYTLQLIYFCFQPLNISPLNLTHEPLLLHSIYLTLISGISIVFGTVFLQHIASHVPFFSLPLEINTLPIVMLTLFLSIILLIGNQCQSFAPHLHFYFSSILNLLLICMRVPSNLHFFTGHFFTNSLETGVLSFIANALPSSLAIHFSRQETLSNSSTVPIISIVYAILLLSVLLV